MFSSVTLPAENPGDYLLIMKDECASGLCLALTANILGAHIHTVVFFCLWEVRGLLLFLRKAISEEQELSIKETLGF